MTSKRKFYRTVFHYEVLSEEPIEDIGNISLEDIDYECRVGSYSGAFYGEVEYSELTGSEMARALQAQGSDPEFFQLDKEGNDIDNARITS